MICIVIMDKRRQRKFFVENHHQELRKLQDEYERLRRTGKYRDPDRELKDWIELEKPVRAGWEQTFELRADVAARKDAATFSVILNHINHSIRSHRKDFRYRKKAKQYETLEPELQIIRSEKWELPLRQSSSGKLAIRSLVYLPVSSPACIGL